MSRSAINPWLNRFAVLTALATLALIGIGGLVTSHGVGMAVPDWPTTNGYNMFAFPISQWVGGIFYEHTHRLWASGVGLLTTILALWLFGHKARPFLRWMGSIFSIFGVLGVIFIHDKHYTGLTLLVVGVAALLAGFFWPRCEPAEKWLRKLGVMAFVAVSLQGLLGGLRVTLIKDEIGIFHAALAQAFLVLVFAIALFTGKWWNNLPDKFAPTVDAARLPRWFIAGTVLIFAQLVVGATMRHQHAGLSIPDFPLAYHKLWPAMDPASVAAYNQNRMEVTAANPITAFQIGLQMVHRMMALLIFIVISFSAWSTRRQLGPQNPLSRTALVWFGLIVLQILLGAYTIWSNKAADVATTHVIVGAMSLVTATLLTIVSFRLLIPARAANRAAESADSGFMPGKRAASNAK
jgi:cytochrome c oxidase assembly protein subunit 15